MKINKFNAFWWLIFALIGTTTVVTLSFRAIPDIDSANDTGRYVYQWLNFCHGSLAEESLANRELSFQFFYNFLYPTCIVGSTGIFLFIIAIFVPLMFLLYSQWNIGTVIWACSLLFSVYGLELMTNAMRQALSLFFLAGAIASIERKKYLYILLGLLAVAAHTSAVAYIPLLFWLKKITIPNTTLKITAITSFTLLLILGLLFGDLFSNFIKNAIALQELYQIFYNNKLNFLFSLFMIFPLYYIYGLRRFLCRFDLSVTETKMLVYSTTLYIGCIFFYPAISYRFAISSIALQIFIVTTAKKPNLIAGIAALSGMIIQLLIMLFLANEKTLAFD